MYIYREIVPTSVYPLPPSFKIREQGIFGALARLPPSLKNYGNYLYFLGSSKKHDLWSKELYIVLDNISFFKNR